MKRFKGIGDVGVDIFFRDAQVAWEELRPFADRRALAAAKRLDLGASAADLSRHVDDRRFPELVAALIRTELSGDHEAVLAGAR